MYTINFPEVSVIISTYNRVHMLQRAITSVLNQGFRDFELIVVDDGSQGATREVVADFQAKDARITYIYQQNSGSPVLPKNTGIKQARGEYIAFLDDDDMWIRIAQKYAFAFVNETLVKRYIHGGNVTETRHHQEVANTVAYLLAKHKSCYEKFPVIYSKWLAHLGTLCVLGGDTKLARRYFMQSIQTAFYYPRNYLNLFLLLFGRNCYTKVVHFKRQLTGSVRV